MAYKLKLAGASVAVALAVAVGTVAGNLWTPQAAPEAHQQTTYPTDHHQAENASCARTGGLVVTEPATKGPLKGLRCVHTAETDSPAL